MFFSNIKWHLPIPLTPKKWHIDWALKFLVKTCHVLTLRTHTINKILTLRILVIKKFHHNNINHHNRMLILTLRILRIYLNFLLFLNFALGISKRREAESIFIWADGETPQEFVSFIISCLPEPERNFCFGSFLVHDTTM
jgi:hypothetical protein